MFEIKVRKLEIINRKYKLLYKKSKNRLRLQDESDISLNKRIFYLKLIFY
jgi:hypothetical protein